MTDGKIINYVVKYTDPEKGSTSYIDNISVSELYTPDDYVCDCAKNDVYWGPGIIEFEITDDWRL